ncbi:hypothetical protein E2C01_065174 [Portunus trituberculatus]|uniref:Uncharacterized protein n=1 Tax=Portunus trituberculatus TaxID=210409 RepID=A0A5B7HI55_PORTR|nr:hypothetical protein [Portunus trituberculatus]
MSPLSHLISPFLALVVVVVVVVVMRFQRSLVHVGNDVQAAVDLATLLALSPLALLVAVVVVVVVAVSRRSQEEKRRRSFPSPLFPSSAVWAWSAGGGVPPSAPPQYARNVCYAIGIRLVWQGWRRPSSSWCPLATTLRPLTTRLRRLAPPLTLRS